MTIQQQIGKIVKLYIIKDVSNIVESYIHYERNELSDFIVNYNYPNMNIQKHPYYAYSTIASGKNYSVIINVRWDYDIEICRTCDNPSTMSYGVDDEILDILHKLNYSANSCKHLHPFLRSLKVSYDKYRKSFSI